MERESTQTFSTNQIIDRYFHVFDKNANFILHFTIYLLQVIVFRCNYSIRSLQTQMKRH